jgi:hypothetical protein
MGETWMEIVILHAEQKLVSNIDYLKQRINGSYHVVQLADFEASFPKMNPDLVIFQILPV